MSRELRQDLLSLVLVLMPLLSACGKYFADELTLRGALAGLCLELPAALVLWLRSSPADRRRLKAARSGESLELPPVRRSDR